MEQREGGRWGLFLVAGGVALAALLLLASVLSGEADRPAPRPITPVPTSADDPAVAIVDGQPIGRDFWARAVLVDRVMSELAGVPVPPPEETLDMLINELLVVRAALPQETPTGEEVEAQIASLEAEWGVGDDQVVAALEAVGLDRGALVQTVARFLVILRAQEVLEGEGTPIDDWLAEQRGRVQVEVYREQMEVVFPSVSSLASPSPLTTPSPGPSSIAVPDFGLEQAGGGVFTLTDQLARGPVVLVFFQRCG